MANLRTTAETINNWYTRGCRPVVVNGQKGYMPAFRKALKKQGIKYHISWQGKKPYRKCAIYVKIADLERAKEACKGLPRDWWAALPESERR